MTIPRYLVLTGVAGLALASLVACGNDDGVSTVPSDAPSTETTDTVDDVPAPTGPPATSAPATTVPTSGDVEPSDTLLGPGQLQLDLVECVQFAVVAPVDADAARSLVPDDVEVLVDAAGMATFTQVSKTCDDMVVDATAMGPGHFDTQWITIVGPEEQRQYPDFPEHVALPTDYLYPVGFATDNEAMQQSVAEFGVPMEVATLEMDPVGPGVWTGSASGPDGDYDWTVDNATAGGLDVYFVHVLERVDDDMVFRYDIECPSTLAWGPGAASLTPSPGSALYDAFGPEIIGEGYAVELTCDVTIDRTMQVAVTEDIAYTETDQLDVYAPSTGADWPTVVYFHGGVPDPSVRKTVTEATELAGQGLVVYVPSWESAGPAGGSEDTVCAVAFAQATAAEYGGDAKRTTITGYSTGGFTAAIHALVGDDPPLPSLDCLVEPVMAAPGAVVPGGAPLFVVDAARVGALDGNPQWSALYTGAARCVRPVPRAREESRRSFRARRR